MKIPAAIVTETGIDIQPDHTRVIIRFFLPGREDAGPGDSRAGPVIDRILDLAEDEVEATMLSVDERFGDRHHRLHDVLLEHAALVTPRIDVDRPLSKATLLLLGACFTHEFSIEGAAVCNPSIVPHSQQDASGELAFVLSVRCVGEGHRSSIGFRTGRVSADGVVTLDEVGRFPVTAVPSPGRNHRSVFHLKLEELGDDHENAAWVLDPLPERFSDAELDARIASLAGDVATRRHTTTTIANLRSLRNSSYRVEFSASTELSERVLWPQAPAESHGMEDARFVRFIGDSGDAVYYGSYTAYDGANIRQHMLETTDFRTFDATPMAGSAASGKGFALFPRQVGGRYAALSRSDRETNSIAFSDDIHCWTSSETIQVPERPWEVLQLGNCGSPIETEAGWLVLTHGVGPMRTYSLGVILLDLEAPQRVVARSDGPILVPTAHRRDGYVPNVVYTCGALAHHDTLVLPYGIADQSISIVTLSITQLLASLRWEH